MAMPRFIQLNLRIIADIARFLLQEDPPRCVSSTTPLISVEEVPPNAIDRFLSFTASMLDINLPRAVTVYNELPVATAYLLKLTEVIPSEVILLLVMCGILFCFAMLMLGMSGVAVGCGYAINKCTNLAHTASHAPSTSEPNTDIPLENDALTVPSLPPLSDAAQALVPSVSANSDGICIRPRRRRYRR